MHIKPSARRVEAIRIILAVAISLIIAGCTLAVQPVEHYVSEDGSVSLTYPAEWEALAESSEGGAISILFGSNPGLAEMETIPSGESGLGVMVLPDSIPVSRGELQEITLEEFAVTVRDSALQDEEVVGELEAVELANYSEVFRFDATSAGRATSAYFVAPSDERLAVFIIMSGEDDMDPELLDKVETVIDSLRVIPETAE